MPKWRTTSGQCGMFHCWEESNWRILNYFFLSIIKKLWGNTPKVHFYIKFKITIVVTVHSFRGYCCALFLYTSNFCKQITFRFTVPKINQKREGSTGQERKKWLVEYNENVHLWKLIKFQIQCSNRTQTRLVLQIIVGTPWFIWKIRWNFPQDIIFPRRISAT